MSQIPGQLGISPTPSLVPTAQQLASNKQVYTGPEYVNGQLTRKGMQQVIAAGGSVLHYVEKKHEDENGKPITLRHPQLLMTEAEIPSIAAFAKARPETQKDALAELTAKQNALQKEIDEVKAAQAEVAKQASIKRTPPTTNVGTDK